jgi:sugar phosphate isomerase/epimerase
MALAQVTGAQARRAERLGGRAGLTVPQDWWASAPLLKSLEAAGFTWAQVHAPPTSILTDPRVSVRHAVALRESLGTTGLGCVLHAPAGLRAGTRDGDRAFEGLLGYAAEIDAEFVVYHACALPDAPESEDALRAEARSLGALARRAERLGVTIAVENLAPVYPRPEVLSANPMTLRGLVHRIGSERVGVCLDLGHAHITSELRHTSIERLCEPVLDVTCLFHLHDNLGARREPGPEALGVDPLRLDLHLPPGRGTVPWQRLAPLLARHHAPLVMEVHPPYRRRASELSASLSAIFSVPSAPRASALPERS